MLHLHAVEMDLLVAGLRLLPRTRLGVDPIPSVPTSPVVFPHLVRLSFDNLPDPSNGDWLSFLCPMSLPSLRTFAFAESERGGGGFLPAVTMTFA